jgi:hypothetical protein
MQTEGLDFWRQRGIRPLDAVLKVQVFIQLEDLLVQ